MDSTADARVPRLYTEDTLRVAVHMAAAAGALEQALKLGADDCDPEPSEVLEDALMKIAREMPTVDFAIPN